MTHTPRSISVREVLARLDARPAEVALRVGTDADGTLWEGDVGDTLFLTLAEHDAFVGEAREALRARAATWLSRPPPDDPIALARALMDRYVCGEIPIGAMCELQAEAAGDRGADEYAAWLDRAADRLASHVRPTVRALLQALVARGATVHVVSGSLGALVESTLRRGEVPFHSVAGATLRREGDRVLPRLAGPIPLFEHKIEALTAAGAARPALGLGDGGWDAPFLRASWLPVLIEPRPALLEALADDARVMRLDLSSVEGL